MIRVCIIIKAYDLGLLVDSARRPHDLTAGQCGAVVRLSCALTVPVLLAHPQMTTQTWNLLGFRVPPPSPLSRGSAFRKACHSTLK